ncbi:DNA topoisomerase IV subunit A [Rhodospirillum rubrum]|uniref:DNA topoisomerase 4 subunit A n=1 Tax=Rhodospirillum rubrum (strain ATCC 11170 / ATH 1.1.1 / DSM 467 / LMG 4362 / NCIMB 8255 / S1) TaxID=269796 RepID=Q2RT97_RHORT|nr:DNA topoisomerase IV subunit A [Rhodospirillum rubrum]ABC22648.1 DNA topoisomerase IV subunit A [Rhodospirillum rubrum ATCC 11170]AEO48366.1 DNA topoisomerase IV subunit A [Rhodospirillum rubrum F11]MBK5954245.1 DNA topoisomerase IV subunit A [Rhodospirillum rubrum]QXG82270.1 DNA topoisomerase IV subunit A [Rhodospirillum rubrum]HCF17928.1 DNA topoisomerase IV subunit A [Rhodospirillum rubrum]
MSKGPVPEPLEIRETPLSEALSERYLAYALSTIVSRSLPDVRDGLKPVHRRLLYAMRMLKLDPGSGFKKCARVVGDVIGKYHPHGDAAVYEAMVRLAQEFAVRYPLVEGQGNFGNIDGDNAAAMRYTEARLTAVASALMEGLDDDAVDFRPTYDGEDHEPVVMPAAFPNLLANGSSGIAVGMATNIPPHNVGELCEALLHLIKVPACPPEALLSFVKGPDFPTGGVLAEHPQAIAEAYRTGRGAMRLRARWEKENLSHGLYQIVITEIPYQIQKAKLVERIAELINGRKLPILADVRDESADDLRLVLEPRNRTVDAETLMEQLFRLTDLEIRFNLNMNVLDGDGVPKVLGLKEALVAFLDHRLVVLGRRSRHRLGKIEHRLEVLAGTLIAYLNLDEVIRIIREEDEPKPALMAAFGLSDVQTEAILNMRLRSLRRLEEMEIRREHDALSAEKAGLEALLADEGLCWKVIAKQIRETRKTFGGDTALGRRRTELGSAPTAVIVPIEALVEREPITVLLSERGWLRAVKGHQEPGEENKFKEGDALLLALHAQTTDKLLILDSTGRFFTLPADKLARGRGFGEPVRLMLDLPNDADIVSLLVHDPARRLILAASGGRGFVVEEKDVLAQTRAGKQVMTVDAGERALLCREVRGDHVAVIGQNRKLLVFPLTQVPVLARGKGVILQRYKDGGIADIKTFAIADGLTWKSGERTRTESDLTAWLGDRAGLGRLPPQGFPRTNSFGP